MDQIHGKNTEEEEEQEALFRPFEIPPFEEKLCQQGNAEIKIDINDDDFDDYEDGDLHLRMNSLNMASNDIRNRAPRCGDPRRIHEETTESLFQYQGDIDQKQIFHHTRIVRMVLCGFGFIPIAFPCDMRNHMLQLLRLTMTLVFLGVNLFMFGFNVWLIDKLRRGIGILHVDTMSTILTGVKPLHNCIGLGVFLLLRERHRFMYIAMRDAEIALRQNFGASPPWAKCNRIFTSLTLFVAIFAFTGRMAQYILTIQMVPPLTNFLNDFSLILVPLMSLWQLLPLFYFYYLNKILQFWFLALQKKLQSDYQLKERNINFYYRHYLLLTKTVSCLGHFFNPFLFFSLGVSVLVLCVTIYFVVNADVAIEIHPNATMIEEISTYFFPMWAGIQIIAAFLYILIIAVSGLKTNETARLILGTALSVAPRDEVGRFQVICFVHKIQTQYSWGITIWRAFPVERSLLFTMFGLISTYAVVLLKLQKTMVPEKAYET